MDQLVWPKQLFVKKNEFTMYKPEMILQHLRLRVPPWPPRSNNKHPRFQRCYPWPNFRQPYDLFHNLLKFTLL